MPKKLEHPDGQLWVRWICHCCKKSGLVSLPGKGQGSGTFPFEVALGIHRTIMKSCNVKDVTMRGGTDGVLEVVLERGKSGKAA